MSSSIPTVDRDHPAHKHLVARLAQRMSDVSEDHWFASWLIGAEYFLWNAIHGGTRDWGIADISDNEIQDLIELSALVGGWHDYHRFIPLDEWLSIVDANAGAQGPALDSPTGDPQ